MLKSIAVVLSSYVLSVLLVFGTGPLLSRLFPGDLATGHVPSTAALMTSTAFFIVISIVCAGLCARFSAAHAARSVLWFFVIGEAMGLIATVPNWNKGWPHWYWLSWLLTWPVSCWIGLLIGERPTGRVTAASA
ncbi:MAG TPA: hypothetical protein VFQ00_08520 [Terriglobales bacterium]|nr:hypothetical protein [Terriglobales bacterium]